MSEDQIKSFGEWLRNHPRKALGDVEVPIKFKMGAASWMMLAEVAMSKGVTLDEAFAAAVYRASDGNLIPVISREATEIRKAVAFSWDMVPEAN